MATPLGARGRRLWRQLVVVNAVKAALRFPARIVPFVASRRCASDTGTQISQKGSAMARYRKEAIELLFDWNKWLITIETAAIAALGFLTKDGGNVVALVAGDLTILTFVCSIFVSSFFLLNLPYLVDGAESTESSFLSHQRVVFGWWLGKGASWQVGKFTAWITRLFFAGISLFAFTFIAALV
jgi:hypothetical protein